MAKSYIDNAEDPRRSGENDPCRFDIGEYILTLMALSFLTKNSNATHRFKGKVMELLEAIDEMSYGDNQDIVWRVALARGIGRAVMQGGAKTLPAVEHRVLEDTEWADYHAAFFTSYRNDTGHAVEGYVLGNELSDEDIKYVDNYVSTRLQFSYLWKSKGFFRELADRIDAGDLGDVAVFNQKVLLLAERLVQKGRHAKATSAQEGQDFSTGDFSFEAAVRAAHAARNKPQSRVKTGLKMFNEMTGGGYEGSRVYVHFGRSGDWKSGWLCNAAFWACDPQLNPRYETKDPTRKPCVLFLTMENDLFETVERMISYSMGCTVELRGSNVDDMVRAMGDAFSSESCQFVFKYRQSRSCSMADVEAMIHDLYMQGLEVVMIVQDYIKRMRAIENFKEARHLELGAIVDEMSVVAKRYNIPLVTGMQLNRGAYDKFEQAIAKGDMAAVKKLGAADAGESINVYENADAVFFQGRIELESTGGLWLTVRRGKMRGKRPSDLDYFAQPYAVDEHGDINEMRLAEDALLPGKKTFGTRELMDGVAKTYDANAGNGNHIASRSDDHGGEEAGDAPLGGTNKQSRSMSRSGGVLKKGGPTKRSAPPPKKAAVPEDAGAAQIEHVPDPGDPVESLGLQGL